MLSSSMCSVSKFLVWKIMFYEFLYVVRLSSRSVNRGSFSAKFVFSVNVIVVMMVMLSVSESS